MSEPESPQAWIEQFLPRRFAEQFEAAQVAALGVSSAPVVLRVVGLGPWSVRVLNGRLVAEPGADAQCALQVSVAEEDFAAFVARARQGALPPAASIEPERMQRWDEETVGLLRAMSGSVLVKVQDGSVCRSLAITPGTQAFDLTRADCTIECSLEDFYELQAGRASPLTLLSEGRLRLTGDAQIAMGLGSLFLF